MTDRPPYDDEMDDAPDDELREYEEYEDHDGGGDDEYLEIRRETPRRRRVLTVVLVIATVLVVAVGAGGLWVQKQIDPSGPPGAVRKIEIPRGSTSDEIGKLLADDGIIASDIVWKWYLRVKGGGPFEAGLYELKENSAIGAVIDVLSAGPRPPDERSVTVPEGLTTAETIARLADPDKGLAFDAATMQQLLDSGQVRSAVQTPGQTSSEGILFPETYRVAAKADALAVLRLMVAQLDATMQELDVASAQARFNLSPYEILTVASLVEAESKVPEDRPKVARVIYNRLKAGIPLGIDATSRYEAVQAGRDRGSVDFTSTSPYNTRRQKGLPPTPITSPGRASIEAALHPADGPWIYYVLKDAQGHHFFTDSSSEFINAKKKCAELGLGCG
ncbi:MAG: endolytic transglycosylase MltG [Acidimicrobiales bacterium]